MFYERYFCQMNGKLWFFVVERFSNQNRFTDVIKSKFCFVLTEIEGNEILVKVVAHGQSLGHLVSVPYRLNF